jgi:large subunit ribosomal protein L21
MQAVLETGSKQYLVKEGDTLLVERLKGDAGSKVSIEDVLLVVDGEKVLVGRPKVAGAKITAEIISEVKGPKRISFKFRRREQYKRTVGHRQKYTKIKIEKIEL